MKRTAPTSFAKDAPKVSCTSTGKKVDGATVWISDDGAYYFCRNTGHFGLAARGKLHWVFDYANQEYVRERLAQS